MITSIKHFIKYLSCLVLYYISEKNEEMFLEAFYGIGFLNIIHSTDNKVVFVLPHKWLFNRVKKDLGINTSDNLVYANFEALRGHIGDFNVVVTSKNYFKKNRGLLKDKIYITI